MNSKRNIEFLYQPEHTIESNENYIPLDPNYISGFFEGDGSFIINLSGNNLGKIHFSIDQNGNNRLLLESFRSILSINSNLILNKSTGVLKLQVSGDRYLKEFLIPFYSISSSW